MHRVPQVVPVNWNGLPPHLEHTRSPELQKFIDNSPNRMAAYQDRNAARREAENGKEKESN